MLKEKSGTRLDLTPALSSEERENRRLPLEYLRQQWPDSRWQNQQGPMAFSFSQGEKVRMRAIPHLAGS
jgi:hypothetical protein